jgi:hypothetical protein
MGLLSTPPPSFPPHPLSLPPRGLSLRARLNPPPSLPPLDPSLPSRNPPSLRSRKPPSLRSRKPPSPPSRKPPSLLPRGARSDESPLRLAPPCSNARGVPERRSRTRLMGTKLMSFSGGAASMRSTFQSVRAPFKSSFKSGPSRTSATRRSRATSPTRRRSRGAAAKNLTRVPVKSRNEGGGVRVRVTTPASPLNAPKVEGRVLTPAGG